jgi:hypothetical protein
MLGPNPGLGTGVNIDKRARELRALTFSVVTELEMLRPIGQVSANPKNTICTGRLLYCAA